MGDSDSKFDAEKEFKRLEVTLIGMVASALAKQNEVIHDISKQMMLAMAVTQTRRMANRIEDSPAINNMQGGTGAPRSERYRNDTERAALGLDVSDPPIHRFEWIAQSSPYDPSTYTVGVDTPGPANEWANELWNPVLHGEAVFYDDF